MSIARLENRMAIRIDGPEAEHFLQNLITTDLDKLEEGSIRPGALLTPQGKVMFDFLISRDRDGFVIDCRSDIGDELVKRMMLYRLRAKVDISKLDQLVIHALWHEDSPGEGWLRDARFADEPVFRRYGETDKTADGAEADWRSLRIEHGVGESGEDFTLGEAFPHDILLDQNGGISFRKGCFVGQEVVSRMQHRGTARRRLVKAKANRPLPPAGTAIIADGRSVGTLGSVAGNRGLAMVRVDRVGEAMANQTPIIADEMEIDLSVPKWASFDFPAPAGRE